MERLVSVVGSAVPELEFGENIKEAVRGKIDSCSSLACAAKRLPRWRFAYVDGPEHGTAACRNIQRCHFSVIVIAAAGQTARARLRAMDRGVACAVKILRAACAPDL